MQSTSQWLMSRFQQKDKKVHSWDKAVSNPVEDVKRNVPVKAKQVEFCVEKLIKDVTEKSNIDKKKNKKDKWAEYGIYTNIFNDELRYDKGGITFRARLLTEHNPNHLNYFSPPSLSNKDQKELDILIRKHNNFILEDLVIHYERRIVASAYHQLFKKGSSRGYAGINRITGVCWSNTNDELSDLDDNYIVLCTASSTDSMGLQITDSESIYEILKGQRFGCLEKLKDFCKEDEKQRFVELQDRLFNIRNSYYKKSGKSYHSIMLDNCWYGLTSDGSKWIMIEPPYK